MIATSTIIAIAYIVEAIAAAAGVAFQVDNTIANAMANNRNTKLAKASKQLANEIAEDDALVNKLLNAYQQKDTDLFQNLINSSPFGSRFSQIKKEYEQNKANIQSAREEASRIQKEGAKAQNELNEKMAKSQTSGEVITDLISGRASVDTSKPDYQRTNLGGENAS